MSSIRLPARSIRGKRKLSEESTQLDVEQKNEYGAKKQKNDAQENAEGASTIGGYSLEVGKAVKDDKKLKQPKAAELGIVPKVAFRWMFTGPSNSGKTNLARWVLDKFYHSTPGKSFFERIYLFSPTGKLDPVWKDLEGLRNGDRITELENGGEARLFEIFNRCIARTKAMGKDQAPHILVIIDDGIADTKFINSRNFMRIFIAGRHGNVSVFVMTQSYNKVPRTARMQLTALAMFPSKTTEIERLWDEHGPLSMDKWGFIEMVQYAIKKTEKEQYPFLFLDTSKPEEERFRRCLYEVLVPSPSANLEMGAQASYSPQEDHNAHAASSPHRPTSKQPRKTRDGNGMESSKPARRRRRQLK